LTSDLVACGGEVNASVCHALECEGVVTDGLVRDLPDVEALGFTYLARGVGVARAFVEILETGKPVNVGGAAHIEPGDVIHADRHGAVVIPPHLVEALPETAEELIARERKLLEWDRSPKFDPGQLAAKRAEH